MSIIVDQAQRTKALDPNGSFLIQAPAGSGKTELLIQRFLKLLSVVNEPENILSITFTRKAAGEMRHRLLQSLELAKGERPSTEPHQTTYDLASKVLKRSQELGWELEYNPGRFQVLTIDSLCAAIAKTSPVTNSFGVLPNVTETPYLHYKKAAKFILNELDGENSELASALMTMLVHLDNNMPRLEELLITMLEKRQQWLSFLIPLSADPDARNYLESVLSQQIEAVQERLLSQLSDDLTDKLHQLFEQINANCTAMGDPELYDTSSTSAFVKSLTFFALSKQGSFRKSLTKANGLYAPTAFKGEEKAQAAQLKATALDLLSNVSETLAQSAELKQCTLIPDSQYSDQQWNVIQALLVVLKHSVAQLKLVFAENSEGDFSEIAELALSALGSSDSPSDLALSLDYRIQHILVDEFQDTSSNQYHLLNMLTSGWQPQDGRTLFLVGDPMQAIYRFREAEVANFILARNFGVQSVELQSLTLEQNFRSDEKLVTTFNDIFSSVFSSEDSLSSGEVAFSRAQSFFKDSEHTQVTASGFVASKDRSLETQSVVQKVQESIDELDEPSIAILARSRPHLNEIAQALSDAEIPFHSVEMQKLSKRQIVLDIVMLVRAITRPADSTAWVSLLRQPVIGLDLTEISYLIESAQNNQLLLSSFLLNHLTNVEDDALYAKLKQVSPLLNAAMAKLSSYPIALVVDNLVSQLGYKHISSYGNSEEDIHAVLSLLESSFESNRLPSIDQLEMKLEKLFSNQTGGPQAKVQLMTIHKSKGLQFDTVIIPGLDRDSGLTDTYLLQWQAVYSDTSEHPNFLLAPVRPSSEISDPTYKFTSSVGNQLDAQELKRLCYVALTRARKRLHMMYCLKPTKDGHAVPTKNTLLSVLWDGLESFQTIEYLEHDPDSPSSAVQERMVPRIPTEHLGACSSDYLPNVSVLSEDEYSLNQLDHLKAKAFGTCVHLELELLAEQGLTSFTHEDIDSRKAYYQSILLETGAFAFGPQLTQAVKEFADIVHQLLDNADMHWIFQNVPGAYSELEVQERHHNFVVTHRLDRYIETEDAIHIIDYKTDRPYHGESHEDFVSRCVSDHKEQLVRYSRLFSAETSKPVNQYLLLASANQLINL